MSACRRWQLRKSCQQCEAMVSVDRWCSDARRCFEAHIRQVLPLLSALFERIESLRCLKTLASAGALLAVICRRL